MRDYKAYQTKVNQQLRQLETTSQQKLDEQKAAEQKQIDELKAQVQAKAEAKARLAAVQAIQTPQPAPALSYTASYINTAYSGCSDAKSCIYFHESGNNPGAINASSGACGLGQALPCSKLPCSLSDYTCQDNWFTGYCLGRYGSWANAWAFWQSNKYW